MVGMSVILPVVKVNCVSFPSFWFYLGHFYNGFVQYSVCFSLIQVVWLLNVWILYFKLCVL